MPAERAPMRKVREVLRLKHALGVSERQIAITIGISRSTIGEYLWAGRGHRHHWNSPFYGIEGQGWFLSFHCFTKYVKVAFFRGTSLRPLPPGESKHKEVRYLDVHEDDQLDEELVASWIRQASELPGWVP
jgi:Domain of unknown function (DU1801)